MAYLKMGSLDPKHGQLSLVEGALEDRVLETFAQKRLPSLVPLALA
jgi:hypothetical protein